MEYNLILTDSKDDVFLHHFPIQKNLVDKVPMMIELKEATSPKLPQILFSIHNFQSRGDLYIRRVSEEEDN